MMRKILLLFALLTALAARADVLPDSYARWQNLPTKELVNMASRFAEFHNKPDSALLAYTIITSRQEHMKTKEDKHYLTVAYIGKWFVYFFHYFDYSKAYENLQHAYELAEKNGDGLARIQLNFGCMYQTISEQSGNEKAARQAMDYYRQAFTMGTKERDGNVQRMALENLVTVAYTLGCMDSIAAEIHTFKHHALDKQHGDYQYTMLLYEGLRQMTAHRYAEALKTFEQQGRLVPKGNAFSRYDYVNRTNQARAIAAMGDKQRALALLHEAEQLAETNDIKDAKLEVYKFLADVSEQAGLAEQTEAYRNRFFRLKDTLLNYQQVASVEEMRFLGELKSMDERVAEMSRQRQTLAIAVGVVVAVAIIVVVFLIILGRKNRRLSQANQSLYDQNVAMLRREKEEREKEARESENKEKYKSSSLDEDSKQELARKIRDVLETPEHLCSSDFSAERLATLLGINYRYLSQVINEKFGKNFNALVNEYRVKEACKRINDLDHYGHLTIEAIASEVGFHARSTFFATFKKQTGLTPAEYLRLARERNDTNE